MGIPEIEVASRLETSEILTSHCGCSEISFLLSIGDQHDLLPAGYDNFPRKLRLLVADLVTEEGPSERDVYQIVELVKARQLSAKFGRGGLLSHEPGSALGLNLGHIISIALRPKSNRTGSIGTISLRP